VKPLEELREPGLLRKLTRRLSSLRIPAPLTLMEVCGTHTMAIHRAGLPALLPRNLRLLSGPGCPVCVTPAEYLDTALAVAREHHVILATFGDMMRVPGATGDLAGLRSEGYPVEVMYSPLGALELARENPQQQVVFLAVGFETTAPTVAATVKSARECGLGNFSILCAHKLIPPALEALLADPEIAVDGFVLPGHVSVVLGSRPYRFVAEKHRRACVITGFEAVDVVQGILMLVAQLERGEPEVEIQYARGVRPEGNARARALMDEVFTVADSTWRGFGPISRSGLRLREEFAQYDASTRFPVKLEAQAEPEGCRCGKVVRGKVEPTECPLFARVCTPDNPVGPCMVSSEGTCAAFYRYSRRERGEKGSGSRLG